MTNRPLQIEDMTSQNKTKSLKQFALIKTRLDFDYKQFLKAYNCRSLYVYKLEDVYLIAVSIKRGFQRMIKDLDQTQLILEVTNTTSLQSARSLIHAVLPQDNMDINLVYRKSSDRSQDYEMVYSQIKNGQELSELLHDNKLGKIVRKDPARYYAYYQMIHNL